MKTWGISILLITYTCICSANIWVGDYFIYTQQEADAFIDNCNCTSISGNLLISGSDIVHLDSLYVLEEVIGTVGITGNAQLQNLSGLSNLSEIRGDLAVQFNEALTTLTGFDNLAIIRRGELNISHNTNLTEVAGFSEMDNIGKNVHISSNHNLKKIEGFEQLRFSEGISICNNSNLDTIKGFDALKRTGSIEILNNGILNDICAFKNLKEVTNSIEINNFWSFLTDIKGFDQLQLIGGDLFISAARQIPLFSKLERIEGKCDIKIPHPQLKEDIFSNLKVIGGLLDCNFTNFQKLDSVSSIIIQPNNKDTLKGFDHLKLASKIEIRHHDNLKHIHAFPLLEHAYTINLSQNKNLNSIAGFEALDSCWNMNISYNPLLTSIGGFQNLQSIQGDLEISNNNFISDIDRFDELREIN